uniref:Chaperone of endosialidase n=1 Tax=Candidatus Kentrum sp. LPFa TaxID=2126335 RepID=A0A450Y574_9GAMM|nr:MAG: Chaperone of endosialidase [Candidatus Kentron sp. LPFa]VFK36675.1 MAG: Chaperone of endosialidase [Candidatus Kentron sp. LPFa]
MGIFQAMTGRLFKRAIPLEAHVGFVKNVEALDPKGVLEKLAAIPVQTWNYKWDDASVRHMGPMAQDFYGAFGLDKHRWALPLGDSSSPGVA